MGMVQISIIVALVMCLGMVAVVVYNLMYGNSSSSQQSALWGAADDEGQGHKRRSIEEIKKISGRSTAKKKTEDVSTKLFKAGYFTDDDKQRFHLIRTICFPLMVVVIPFVLYSATSKPMFALIGLALGMMIGYIAPLAMLDRAIRLRQDETMYYLPLVIEQVSIGVSSSLDIGPCIAHIVTMANERDSHNPITEMFIHIDKLIKSGMNLEESLMEVAEANGMSDVKHAFMFLSQCAKHGGEVSKQLQELADSIMTQRQVHIEGKITALPVKATGPLATVFAGFFALLFSGLLVRIMEAFGT